MTVREGVRKTVTWEEMEEALRPHDVNSSFSSKEVYVRDCFDNLFDAIEQIEHFPRIELIEFEDVRYPLGYYISKLREHEPAVGRFIEFYEYRHAAAFIARF